LGWEEILPLLLGFGLGIISGPIGTFIATRIRLLRMAKMLYAELQQVEEKIRRVSNVASSAESPMEFRPEMMALTNEWFWSDVAFLEVLPKDAFHKFIELRANLRGVETTITALLPGVDSKGAIIPSEYALQHFSNLKHATLDSCERSAQSLADLRNEIHDLVFAG